MATSPWNIADAIEAELQSGEIVRWTGKPTFIPMLARQFIPLMIGFAFVGIGVQPVIPVAQSIWLGESAKDIWPALLSCLFVILGFASIAKAFLDAIATSRTAYAVTNRRVLIVCHLFHKRVLAFGPNGINAVETSENFDGSGTVVFRREISRDAEGDATIKLAFVGIADVATAAREIEKLRFSGQLTSDATDALANPTIKPFTY